MTRGRKAGGENPGVKHNRPLQTGVRAEVEKFFKDYAAKSYVPVSSVVRIALMEFYDKHKQ
jgi:hypothetical protein